MRHDDTSNLGIVYRMLRMILNGCERKICMFVEEMCTYYGQDTHIRTGQHPVTTEARRVSVINCTVLPYVVVFTSLSLARAASP